MFVAIQPALQWGWSEVLSNKMVYLLETLVWMKTKDASKKPPRNQPKLFVPDFMPKNAPESEISKGAEVHTTDEIADILAKPRV